MKKIFFGAAVATMMFASCQNDMIESVEQQGRMFTLEVNQGGSRTALDGLQTVWSKGDQIYVTSEDGQTTGVLTLIGEGGDASGKFSGFVFGNGELKYSVYPASKIKNMGEYDANRLDAPMTGQIQDGVTTFNNEAGLVKLLVLGLEEGQTLKVEAENIGSEMKYSLAGNTWINTKAGDVINVKNAQDGEYVYIPVCLDEPATRALTELTLTVTVGNLAPATVTVNVAEGKVNDTTPIISITDDGVKNLTQIIEPSDDPEDESVFETVLNISDFNDALIENNGSFDGKGKVLVELKDSDFGTYNKLINKNGEYVYQYYIGGEKWSTFDKYDELNVQNVTFIFVDDNKNNTITTGELQTFINDVSFENCTFIGTTVSPWVLGFSGDKAKICGESAVFNECNFVNIYNRNAIHQNKAKNFVVNECIFTNCSGGMHINANEPESVEITNNKFVESQEDAVMLSIGLEGGDYQEIEKMTVTGNIAEGMYCIRLWKENVTLNQINAIKANNKYKEFYHTKSIQIK